jgi:serine/threonine-protein kinase
MAFGPGSKLGPYEIRGALGIGGMGEVYRARDSKLGRDVALKVLPEFLAADSERLGRFGREAQVLASLNHPNIAVIYGLEDSSGAHALVMELVEGPTLAEKIAERPMLLAEALPIAKQVSEALEYAHDRGIVHRDLKPANVKITPDGAVKLLDFGLAKALDVQAVPGDISSSPTITNMATQAGILLGTPAYMSPEQAKARPVDRRADIWAFGAVLFEMLTGKMAFSGESVTDTIAEIIKTDPEWSLIPAGTPQPIRILLYRCLKKDPKQRQQAIGEARIAIEEVLAGKDRADLGATDTAPARGARRERRSQPVVGWIGGFLIGSLLAAALAWWLSRPASTPAAMHFSAVTSFAGIQGQPTLSPDGRSVAFVSNRDGHFNIYVGLVRGGEIVEVTHGSSLKSRPSWSPDGSMIAYAQMNEFGGMDVWETAALGGTPRKIVLHASDPTWMPDGRSLVYENLADGAIWASGVAGENPHLLVRMEPGMSATEPRVSPDGRMVAAAIRIVPGGPYGELGIADLNTGKIRLLTKDNALALSPAWAADSKFIYFSSSRGGTLNIWKMAADGSALRQITAGEGDDTELDVSSDGQRLVFATLRLNIGLAQLDREAAPDGASVKVIANDPARNEFGPVYSPDGTRIAFFTNLKGVENESVSVADANGRNAIQLVRDSRVNLFPRWSPDGTRLLYYSTSFPPQPEYRSVSISGGAPEIVMKTAFGLFDVARDNRLLYQNDAGEIKVFDPRDGKDRTLGNIPANGALLRWLANDSAASYIVWGQQGSDPNLGIWVTDFKNPPRQLFRGWVSWYGVDAKNEIVFLKGKDDLAGELWKVNWDGSGLSRVTPTSIPLLYNPNYTHSTAWNQIDVSPDGRRIVFQSQQVLQENIGIIEGLL